MVLDSVSRKFGLKKLSDSVSKKFGIGKKFWIRSRSGFGYLHTLDDDGDNQCHHNHCHHHDDHSRLKERGIKIAICTSDSREGTIEFLERMGLQSMVDIIVCGDDEVKRCKQ